MKTERTFYLGVIAVLSVLLFLERSCHAPIRASKCPCDDSNTLFESNGIVTDTVILEKKDSTKWHTPAPIKESSNEAQEAPQFASDDSFLQSLPDSVRNGQDKHFKDSLAVADYWTFRQYSDTNNLEAGQVIVLNAVRANRLAIQSVILNSKEKTVTIEKTVTKVTKEAPRGQMFAGIIAQGMRNDPLTGFGAQLQWKTKRDKVWTASVIQSRFGDQIFQIGALWKLSFRK